jgi:hypothetical protein
VIISGSGGGFLWIGDRIDFGGLISLLVLHLQTENFSLLYELKRSCIIMASHSP